ncbi:MAG: DNA-processing protein DprA, partial [Longimicrobiales bacterium]|nr:DNA-processing protein DprA [Longimicrobiales bacterium]
ATAYGRRVARELGRALGEAGVTVVSGLALGVDGEAHRGALDREGRTIAVLAAGTDRAQPPGQHRLFRDIVATGGVWSEHPPGTRVEKYHFPERNRLIAALGCAVIVVEAAAKSGALITARLGLEAGADVWAVPGRIDFATSRGTNALIRDGARPVCSLGEVVEAYGRTRRAGPQRPAGVSPTAEVLWEILDRESDLDAIIDAWPGDAPDASLLLAALAELELGGWVVRAPGTTWVRRAA